MRRREFIGGINAALILAACLQSEAQQIRRIKIGYLIASSRQRPIIQKYLRAFLQSLESFGYVEGQNVSIEYRFAELDFDRLPRLAAELVDLKVDVIVAAPTPAAVAAKRVTDTVPIVMINAGDPVGRGLVDCLARPGGNVTGLTFSVGLEHFNKAIELLKEAVPAARKVAILQNPVNPTHADIIEQISQSAARLNWTIKSFEASREADIEPAFAVIAKDGFEALIVVADALFGSAANRVAQLTARYRLPSLHQLGEEAECRRGDRMRRMSAVLARNGPQAMSAIWSLTGA